MGLFTKSKEKKIIELNEKIEIISNRITDLKQGIKGMHEKIDKYSNRDNSGIRRGIIEDNALVDHLTEELKALKELRNKLQKKIK